MICDQAQKELLDAELDFHKKMSSGEDTTDLKRKLGQLQVEVIHVRTQYLTTDQRSEKIAGSATSRSLKTHLTQTHTKRSTVTGLCMCYILYYIIFYICIVRFF